MLRNVVPPDDALHRAGVRHDHDIVLVGALNAESFRGEHADDDEGHVLDPQDLTDGIVVAEDLRGGGLADNADFIGAAHVLRGKWRALRQRPLTNIEIIRRFAHHPGKPVLVAGRDLRGGRNFFADRGNAGTSRRIASASSIFNVPAPPQPVRMPLEVVLPEKTTMTFCPRLAICAST